MTRKHRCRAIPVVALALSSALCACGGKPFAPPLDPTIVTNLADATSFLYTGDHPVQVGVAPGTIDRRRVTVLRGTIHAADGSPLSGVTVSVLGHSELGFTSTRADGQYDLAANGGAPLTLQFAKRGFLPAQRQALTPQLDYVVVPDVVMLAPDAHATPIKLGSGMQVARGSVSTDAAGARQATLMFPAGTQAMMMMPSGGMQPADTLNVRLTEFTVGDAGDRAMPAALPPTSAFTYALELSADETETAGASGVVFSQPVPLYVDNFLGFPVGAPVPAAYYDGARGLWVPSQSGQVVRVLGVSNGLADLDLDGSGTAASAAALAAAGISDDERRNLAAAHKPGDSLWRVPIAHFSCWDLNQGFSPPPDAVPPDGTPDDGNPDDHQCTAGGSIIECQSQVLAEELPIAGTPYFLRYQSDRAVGRKALYTLDIPVTGDSVPASLAGVDLEISVAGRQFSQKLGPAPSQRYAFTWDGKDGYGRTLQGSQPITVRTGYVYKGVYQTTPRFGSTGNGQRITSDETRKEVTLWSTWSGDIGPFDARALGFGGWTLDVHHVYDPNGQTLFFGDGRRRSARSLGKTIHTVTGVGGSVGDGVAAVDAMLGPERGLAFGPDGSLYVSDESGARVHVVRPDGTITTFAGTTAGFGGDGGPATMAQLDSPEGICVGIDGALYIADNHNHRIRRVDGNGVITTIAGTGATGGGGDGGPATMAQFTDLRSIACGLDGSLFVVDNGTRTVRRIAPDGTIEAFAGNGTSGVGGDNGPAVNASLTSPQGIAVAPDGTVYISDLIESRVAAVSPSGIIRTVAGSDLNGIGFGGDGGPASMAKLHFPDGLAVGPDGTLYIADESNNRVRAITPDGVITTVVGSGDTGDDGDGGPATAARFYELAALAVGGDGTLYLSDKFSHRVRAVTAALPRLSLSDSVIPDEDGSELYVFDGVGRHLRTLGSLTGAIHYQFAYGPDGRLTSVTDAGGNATTFLHDGTGNVKAIQSPDGKTSGLVINANGLLATMSDPTAAKVALTYDAGGLLTSLTDPLGHVHKFTYDGSGMLASDADPAGGTQTLAASGGGADTTVTRTTSLGHPIAYRTQRLAGGELRRTTTDPAGLMSVVDTKLDGTVATQFPDGSVATTKSGPDPRFGMQAPLTVASTATTPGGLAAKQTLSSTATLGNAIDPLSLTQRVDTYTLAGRSYSRAFDAASKTTTWTTAAGRTSSMTLDAADRVATIAIPGFLPLQMGYDARGRLTSVSQGARQYQLAYDAKGNVASMTDPSGATAQLTYDADGRPTQAQLPGGRTLTMAWDADGNRTMLTPPGQPAHRFAFDSVDLETDYVPPGVGAFTTHISYDLEHKIVQVARSGGALLKLAYDAGDRLSTMTEPGGTTTLGYDPMSGHLASITARDGGVVGYGYDGALRTSTTWSGAVHGSVQRTFNPDLTVASESVDGSAVAFAYDADGLVTGVGPLTVARDAQNGRITGMTLGNVSDTRAADGWGGLATLTATGAGAPLLSIAYTRDLLERTTRRDETIGGTTHSFVYGYDAAGRLTDVSEDGNTVAHYEWDANGNRTKHVSASGTTTATYDQQDRLVQAGNKSYTFGAAGDLQLVADGAAVTWYHYDFFGGLTAVRLPDGTNIQYVLDGAGHRIGKRVNGTLVQAWLYDDLGRPLAELDGAGNLVSRFLYGTTAATPDAMLRGGATYRILSDAVGTPRLVVDAATGAIVQRLDYDEFGVVLADSNPGFQPFGFGGGLYDRDTRLVRFGARDYDPETGRFTTKDPLSFGGGDANLYAYAVGEPIDFTDPSGTFPFLVPIVSGGFGAVGNALGNLAGQLLTTGCVKWGDVAVAAGTGFLAGAAAPFLGTSLLGTSLLGGTANVVQTAVTNWVDGKSGDLLDYGLAFVTGAGAGLIGGKFTINEPSPIFTNAGLMPTWRFYVYPNVGIGNFGRGFAGGVVSNGDWRGLYNKVFGGGGGGGSAPDAGCPACGG